jgi:hypothetical protein
MPSHAVSVTCRRLTCGSKFVSVIFLSIRSIPRTLIPQTLIPSPNPSSARQPAGAALLRARTRPADAAACARESCSARLPAGAVACARGSSWARRPASGRGSEAGGLRADAARWPAASAAPPCLYSPRPKLWADGSAVGLCGSAASAAPCLQWLCCPTAASRCYVPHASAAEASGSTV